MWVWQLELPKEALNRVGLKAKLSVIELVRVERWKLWPQEFTRKSFLGCIPGVTPRARSEEPIEYPAEGGTTGNGHPQVLLSA